MEPEPICEGDEYTIAVTVEDAGKGAEPPSLDIVVRRFGADGSVEELHLEGDLADAQSLAIQLLSEGDCVVLQALPPEGDDSSEDDASTAPAEVSPLE